MRVIIYGTEKTAAHLSLLLENEGIEVEVRSSGQEENPDWKDTADYDMAIIDSTADIARIACQNIRESGDIPIALMIDPRQADWKTLESLDADCYLLDLKRDGEMAARLRAALRRFSSTKM